MKILETLTETSESPLAKEPEESLVSPPVVVKPDLPQITVSVSVTQEEPVKQESLVESKGTKSSAAATVFSTKLAAARKAPVTATKSASSVDSRQSGAEGVVRRKGVTSEKRKVRRIRTNSQVETII